MMTAAELGALLVIAGIVAVSLALRGASSSGQTSLASNTTMAVVNLIEAGTTQSLPFRGGVPVCYDTPFDLSKGGTLSRGLRATGLINWYILSESQGPPISGTIISGTMTQTIPSGSYVLEFCNQQRSSLNLTIVESFVVAQA
jgi:hypothetical protein